MGNRMVPVKSVKLKGRDINQNTINDTKEDKK